MVGRVFDLEEQGNNSNQVGDDLPDRRINVLSFKSSTLGSAFTRVRVQGNLGQKSARQSLPGSDSNSLRRYDCGLRASASGKGGALKWGGKRGGSRPRLRSSFRLAEKDAEDFSFAADS